jgi:Flp pilus assembly protein TadD
MVEAGRTGPRTGRLVAAAMAIALSAAVTGCATDRITTGSVDRSSSQPLAQMTAQELHAATDSLGRTYTRDPRDKGVALRYASALQMTGRTDQSLAVMRKLAIDHPEDRQVLAEYGKSLAAAGELKPALDAVRRAQTPEYPDWRLISAEAAILDQLGETDQARRLYRRALDMAPEEPSVLSISVCPICSKAISGPPNNTCAAPRDSPARTAA